jgi:hypothetical protein
MDDRNTKVKKEKVDNLRKKFRRVIKADRYYASTERVPLFNEWIVGFRPTFFSFHRILESSSSSSSSCSRTLLEEDDDDVEGETAEEKLIREDYEMELERYQF